MDSCAEYRPGLVSIIILPIQCHTFSGQTLGNKGMLWDQLPLYVEQ